MTAERLTILTDKYLFNAISTEELKELHFILQQPDMKLLAEERLLSQLVNNEYQVDVDLSNLQQKIAVQVSANNLPRTKSVHRTYFLKSPWFRYAAAIIIIVTGAAIWYTQRNHSKSFNPLNPSSRQIATITPNHDRAILTLAKGQQITLDSTKGNIVSQPGLIVMNKNGKLDYEGVGNGIEHHTLSTPKGGQYQLVLPDGSKVWLNAASGITYPTAFTGKDRTVSITGEAYFEVTKDTHKPFIVKTYKDEIVVLGTSFNVNSYQDEPTIRTSLLEGSVKVNDQLLKPGQAYKNGEVIATNVEQDLAWKEGLFNFGGMDTKAVLRQLSRWYDIEIVFDGDIPERKFGGEMSRDLNLAQMLELLQKMEVHFKMEGRKLIVTK